MSERHFITSPRHVEYGVRKYGGHIEPTVSLHVAVREVEQARDAGEKNVWLVVRHVTDWEKA